MPVTTIPYVSKCIKKVASVTLPGLAALLVTSMPVHSQTQQSLNIGDHTVEYVQMGDGQTIVFVHGSISDAAVWDEYHELMSDDVQTVAYTQRYFGDQPWPDDGSGFSFEVLHKDLIAFVEKLDRGPVDLVTWSLGGLVGLNATRLRPDLFRSAIHFEPVSDIDKSKISGYEAAEQAFFANFGPAFDALGAGDNETAALRFVEAVFDLPIGAAESYPEASKEMWKRNAQSLMPNMSTPWPEAMPCETFSAIKTPSLFVVGSDTFDAYSLEAKELARCVPGAELKQIEGTNHSGPISKAEEFSTIIMDFLAQQ